MAKIIDLSIQISEDLPRWKVEVNKESTRIASEGYCNRGMRANLGMGQFPQGDPALPAFSSIQLNQVSRPSPVLQDMAMTLSLGLTLRASL